MKTRKKQSFKKCWRNEPNNRVKYLHTRLAPLYILVSLKWIKRPFLKILLFVISVVKEHPQAKDIQTDRHNHNHPLSCHGYSDAHSVYLICTYDKGIIHLWVPVTFPCSATVILTSVACFSDSSSFSWASFRASENLSSSSSVPFIFFCRPTNSSSSWETKWKWQLEMI